MVLTWLVLVLVAPDCARFRVVISVMIGGIVQPVRLAVASKGEETGDQLNHEQKSLLGPKFLKV
jgi:hypothetical protein